MQTHGDKLNQDKMKRKGAGCSKEREYFYPLDKSFMIHWNPLNFGSTYSVGSAIQLLKNWGQGRSSRGVSMTELRNVDFIVIFTPFPSKYP